MAKYNSRFSTDPVIAAQQGTGPETQFAPVMLDHLFVALIRCPSFLAEARSVVNVNQFNPMTEQHYQALWNILCYMQDNFGAFTREDLRTECHRYLLTYQGTVLPQSQDRLLREDEYGVIYYAFAVPADQITLEYCRGLLRQFLHERTVASPLRRFLDSVALGEHPAGLNDFLDNIAKQRERIEGMRELPTIETVPALTSVLQSPSVFHSTGIDWIDRRLGGQREGDANGILGVTGAGKSTLAAYMAVRAADVCRAEALSLNKRPDMVAIFTDEESAAKMQPRVWSAAMKIDRTRLERITNPATELSGPGNLQEYEIRAQYGSAEILSEQQRWERDRQWLNDGLQVFDMSGSEKFPHAGNGYIAEIKASLEKLLNDRNCGLRTIVIDYAGLVARRYMQINNLSDDQLRKLLTEFGDQCRRQLSEYFGATTWIMHQIAGQSSGRSATSLLNHTMAAESKSFAENLSVCGCLGSPDPRTGCRLLNFSKVRYAPTEQVDPVTLKIDERYAILEDVGSQFRIDESSHSFIGVNEVSRVGGAEAIQSPSRPRPRTGRAAEVVAGMSPIIHTTLDG